MEIKITASFEEGYTNCFDVHFEGRIAQSLTYDETVGLVTSIIMPEKRPCLQWLKTPEQIAIWEQRMKEKSIPPVLLPPPPSDENF